MENNFKKFLILSVISLLFVMPCFALDLDSTVNDAQRKNYSKQQATTVQKPVQPQSAQVKTIKVEKKDAQPVSNVIKEQTTVETKSEEKIVEPKPVIKQDLPKVPNLPSKANSSTSSPINHQYSGRMPNSEAFIPCTDIKVGDLIIDESVVKSKSARTRTAQTRTTKPVKTVSYRTAILSKGTQIRAINQSRIADSLVEGQAVVFTSTQDLYTPYFKIPKGTKFVARVEDSHRPQMTCNGGLVGLKIVSANINGYNQQLDGRIYRLKNERVYFSNLKGQHTYCKTVCKKAKWGQNKFKQWSKTSHQLANKGAGVIIAPFPYIGGCILAGASTISSPVTALLGKGGNLVVPAKTTFTLKLNSDARLRY